MRKIDIDVENPIDNIIIHIAEKGSPIYKELKMTPNHLTTISVMCNILSCMLLYKRKTYLSALIFLIGYYFDCADGFYARKYDMVTKFGDYYDHVNDNLRLILILIIMFMISPCKLFKILPIILLLGLMASIHLGCQEKIYHKKTEHSEESPTLEPLKNICFGNRTEANEAIQLTKYFGCGTFFIIFAGFIATF